LPNTHYTGWSKKVNHYQESSLNRIKTVSEAIFLITKLAQVYYAFVLRNMSRNQLLCLKLL